MRRIAPLALLVLFTSICIAQAVAGRALTQQQRDQASQLDQEWSHLKRKDPKSWEKERASTVLDVQEILGRFGYGTLFTAILDDRTQEALQNYQRRNGLPATGDVDGMTWICLQEDRMALEGQIPSAPMYAFLDSEWDNFVKVEGAWFEVDKNPDENTPLSTAVIECVKPAGLCVAANSSGTGYTHLLWFEVERWDQYEITSKPYDLPCGRETLHITRPDKMLLVTNTAAYKNAEACTKLFGPVTKSRVSRLGSIEEIMDTRLERLHSAEARINLVSPEARRRAGLSDAP